MFWVLQLVYWVLQLRGEELKSWVVLSTMGPPMKYQFSAKDEIAGSEVMVTNQAELTKLQLLLELFLYLLMAVFQF